MIACSQNNLGKTYTSQENT